MIHRIFSLPFRKLHQLCLQAHSCLKKMGLRLIYPGVTFSGKTFLAKGCVINCTNDATIRLENVHVSEGVQLVARHGGILDVKDTFIGPNSVIVARSSIQIDSHCLIAEMVVIRDQDHKPEVAKSICDSGFETGPIQIGQNVWLGAKSTVLKGVNIGDHAVVGAHSLVNTNIPAKTIAVGAPAKPVKTLGGA